MGSQHVLQMVRVAIKHPGDALDVVLDLLKTLGEDELELVRAACDGCEHQIGEAIKAPESSAMEKPPVLIEGPLMACVQPIEVFGLPPQGEESSLAVNPSNSTNDVPSVDGEAQAETSNESQAGPQPVMEESPEPVKPRQAWKPPKRI